ncbi:putative RING finger protein 10 [Iris pallida]|uniref:RING finger protein 10 n=1 Tax=Iris pallida TaxID=29817 RepID=A0AAX6HJG8_IRIPA|nr:putative RING finger protein 10 [Iris pallida]
MVKIEAFRVVGIMRMKGNHMLSTRKDKRWHQWRHCRSPLSPLYVNNNKGMFAPNRGDGFRGDGRGRGNYRGVRGYGRGDYKTWQSLKSSLVSSFLRAWWWSF